MELTDEQQEQIDNIVYALVDAGATPQDAVTAIRIQAQMTADAAEDDLKSVTEPEQTFECPVTPCCGDRDYCTGESIRAAIEMATKAERARIAAWLRETDFVHHAVKPANIASWAVSITCGVCRHRLQCREGLPDGADYLPRTFDALYQTTVTPGAWVWNYKSGVAHRITDQGGECMCGEWPEWDDARNYGGLIGG